MLIAFIVFLVVTRARGRGRHRRPASSRELADRRMERRLREVSDRDDTPADGVVHSRAQVEDRCRHWTGVRRHADRRCRG